MENSEQEITFKSLFLPLTKRKIVTFIVLIGLLVFANSLSNPFFFDDFPQIVNNPEVKNLNSIPSFFTHSLIYPGENKLGFLHIYYKPLLYVSYTLLYSFFGGATFHFHAAQIIIHILNTIILFLTFSVFFKKSVSFLLSLIFLVHPINSETVIYIADLQDVLFVFFGLSALYLCLTRENTKLISLALIILLLFSLLSKETGIVFPLIIISLTLINQHKHNLKKISLISLITLLLYGSLRFLAFSNSKPIVYLSLIQRSDLLTRIISLPKIIFYYLSHFLYPVSFATGQSWLVRNITLQNFYFPLLFDCLFFLCVFWGGIYLYRKKDMVWKNYFFFFLWFMLGLFIHLQIIPLDLTVADRWFYFPLIGLLGLIGVLINKLSFKNIGMEYIFSLCALIIFALCVLTIIRNSQWQSPLKLYTHDVKFVTESPALFSYYAALLMNMGKYSEAKYYLDQSVALDPQIGNNIINLAIWYEHENNFWQAKRLFWKNIEINKTQPSYIAVSYESLARILLVKENKFQEAKIISEKGLEKFPEDNLLLEYLAVSEYQLGLKEKAVQTIEKAYTNLPNQQNLELYNLIKSDKFKL